MNEITLKEFAQIFKFIIENNRRLEDEGRKTTAVGLTGLPGLGKTMTIRQLAEELGMTCVVVRLSQIEEIGEISGRFNYEFLCCITRRVPRVYIRNGKTKKIVDYLE